MKERKNKHRLLITAIVIIVLGAAAVGGAALSGGLERDAWSSADAKLRAAKGYYEQPEVRSVSYGTDEIESISMTLKHDSVMVAAGEGDRIDFKYFIDYENQYEISADNKTLSVVRNADPAGIKGMLLYPDLSWILGAFDGEPVYDIIITVPQDFEMTNLTITGASGNFHVENVAAEVMDLTLDSGNITAENVKAGNLNAGAHSGNVTVSGAAADKLDARLTSGSLKVKDSAVSGGIIAQLTSGNATFTGTAAQSCEAGITSGNLRLIGCTIYKNELSARSGNITLKDLPQGFTSETAGFDIRVGSGAIRVDGKSRGGSFKASPENPLYTVTAQLTSGSFKFN